MLKGKVLQAFVDRHTRRYHARGTIYASEDQGRMEQLADGGYIEFEPPKPDKEGKDGTKKSSKNKKADKE